MSFLGKKFKRVDTANMEPIIEKLNITKESLEKLREIGDIVIKLQKNSDGSLQFFVERDGKQIHERKIELNKEQEITTLTGSVIKVTIALNGEELNGTIKNKDGSVLHILLSFNGSKGKMIVHMEGDSHKGEILYETI